MVQVAGGRLPERGGPEGSRILGSGSGAGHPRSGRFFHAGFAWPAIGFKLVRPDSLGLREPPWGPLRLPAACRGSPPEELGLIAKTSRLAAIAIEQRQLTDKLAYQAQHDTLTGLPNRALFEDRLQRALAMARRQGWLAAVLFVDLDRFKQINDTLGHPVGDALLQQVARRLENCIRRTDTLARMGGDEFTLLLTELHDQQYSL